MMTKFSDANFKYYLENKFIINTNVLYKGIDIPVKMTGKFYKRFFN